MSTTCWYCERPLSAEHAEECAFHPLVLPAPALGSSQAPSIPYSEVSGVNNPLASPARSDMLDAEREKIGAAWRANYPHRLGLTEFHHHEDREYANIAVRDTPTGMAERTPSSAIATWQDRMGPGYIDGGADLPEEVAMKAEIADLRAALARRATAGALDALRSIRDLARFDASPSAVTYYRKAENALAAIECRDAVELERATAGTTLPTESKAGEGGASALRAEPAGQHDASLPVLPAIDYDKSMDRTYIPLPGGWEIQTKGKGSTFRIAHAGSHTRWMVLDENLHEPLEALARDMRNELAAGAARQGGVTCNKGTSECAATAVPGDLPEPIWNPLDTPEFREVLGAYVKASEKVSLVRPESIAAYDTARKALTDFIEAWGAKEAARLASNAVAAQQPLMRQAVASVASHGNGEYRVAWMRPERVQVGSLLYCIERAAPSNNSGISAQEN